MTLLTLFGLGSKPASRKLPRQFTRAMHADVASRSGPVRLKRSRTASPVIDLPVCLGTRHKDRPACVQVEGGVDRPVAVQSPPGARGSRWERRSVEGL